MVADRLYDDTGAVIGTAGYYIDLGADLAEQRQAVLGETLPDVVGARAVIEQAKGALMLVYGITAEDAFAILRWRSQETNSKLRELAAKLTTALTAAGRRWPGTGAAPKALPSKSARRSTSSTPRRSLTRTELSITRAGLPPTARSWQEMPSPQQ